MSVLDVTHAQSVTIKLAVALGKRGINAQTIEPWTLKKKWQYSYERSFQIEEIFVKVIKIEVIANAKDFELSGGIKDIIENIYVVLYFKETSPSS